MNTATQTRPEVNTVRVKARWPIRCWATRRLDSVTQAETPARSSDGVTSGVGSGGSF
jgi:hypothetical protein